MAETIHERIERERSSTAPSSGSMSKKTGKWEIIREFRDYARGRQLKTLNADQMRIMSSVVKHDFSDNVLQLILWTHANRLRVARFDVEDDAVSDFLYDLWVRNQFPDLFADSTYATLRDGNHAISLDWKPSDDLTNQYGGRVQLSRERWWDGNEGVFIMYGDDGQPEYAVKEWLPLDEQPLKRRTIYFPDAIYRYVFDGNWKPYTLPGEEDLQAIDPQNGVPMRGVIPWLKRDGTPLGIPVIHLPNGSDDDTYYGASLLDGGPLAFQDQLNAIQHDITAAALMNGSPQTFSKGFSLPDDPNDLSATPRKIKVKTGPGMHHHADEPTASFETITPGDLTQLASAYQTKLSALCRNTNTPLHLITGQWPSGEAIFRAEMPLIGAVMKLGESLGPQWSTVAHRATEIANAYGQVQLDENALIQTVFEPPEQRDPITLWTAADKAAPYVSTREVLRLVGYMPDRIDAIMDERADEKAESVSAAQAAFSRPVELDALQRAAGQSIDVTEGNDNAGQE